MFMLEQAQSTSVSIVKKKAFGGAAPRYKRLEDHRRCRGVTPGNGGTPKKQCSKLSELSQTPIAAPTEKGMFPYSSQSSKLSELSQAPIAAPIEKGTFPYNSKASGSAGTTGNGFPPLKSGSHIIYIYIKLSSEYLTKYIHKLLSSIVFSSFVHNYLYIYMIEFRYIS